MTAPGTILLAKMLVPETEKPLTAGRVEMADMERDVNVLGAISRGTIDGLHLALNVAAMLISFIALIYLVDGCFSAVHNLLAAHARRWFPSSVEQIFGWVFSPVAWVIGIPWHDCHAIGNLLGLRMVTNELVAFQRLGPMQATLDPRSFTIATFALCGFANFSSIGIQIGGIGALAPNKSAELAQLGHSRHARRHDGQSDVRFASSGSCCDERPVRSRLESCGGRRRIRARASAPRNSSSSKTKLRPKIALVLGSGLGAFADEFASATRIPYDKIPGFPRSTVEGHAGRLVIGKVDERSRRRDAGPRAFLRRILREGSGFSDARASGSWEFAPRS